MIRMNRSFGPFCRVLLLLLAAALFPAGAEAHAAASSAGRAEDTAAQKIAEEEPDVKRIVLGHVGDSYEWHIATAGGREWSLPLPVIVHSPSSGWHCFSAKRLRGGAEYEGLRIAADGDHAGKIVERQADAATSVRWTFRSRRPWPDCCSTARSSWRWCSVRPGGIGGANPMRPLRAAWSGCSKRSSSRSWTI